MEQPNLDRPDTGHEVSQFEREVRRGAVVNAIRRRLRRRALSRPIPGWWLRTTRYIDWRQP
jgi:hypothetical protein